MNSLIECLMCKNKFEQPVLLPCGHTVCKKHSTLNNQISCAECDQTHEIPKKGFPENKLADRLIQYEFDQLDFGPDYSVTL